MSAQFVQAILLGGYYSLLAAGLAFMFSVMRLINLAHGSVVVLAAYLVWALSPEIGFMAAAAAAMVLCFALGGVVQVTILSRATGGGEALLPLLATFGLAVVLDNAMFSVLGADTRSLAPFVGDLSWASFELPGGIFVGRIAVYTLIAAIMVIGATELMLRRTALGHRIRAVSLDRSTAGLLGVDAARTAAIAAGIAFAMAALAGIAMGLRGAWSPYAGSAQLLFAFEAVVIGGIGSLWRVLAGGIVLALAQAIGALIHPQGFLIGGHLAFLLAVLVRARGLAVWAKLRGARG